MNAADDLAGKTCEPCRGGVPPMTLAEAQAHLPAAPGWSLAGGEAQNGATTSPATASPLRLTRAYRFPDFASAQDFVVKVGAICEAEGHHAEIAYGWGHATIQFWTHKIGGLHENDFIMAAKASRLTP